MQATNLHRWGAVTLFHGLPSDRVRAVAQDAEGAMWFGTDNGLARYDGRRTQSISIQGLAAGRVLALQVGEDQALWAGTETGAARWAHGEWRAIEETKGKSINAILTRGAGHGAHLATTQGQILACDVNANGSIGVRALPAEALRSADVDQPGALEMTSLLAGEGEALLAGTRSRGLLAIEQGTAREINSRPRAYFIEALERDARGVVWVGARARGRESGLYEAKDLSRPLKVGEGLGTVTTLRAGAGGDLWVGTAERGVFLFRAGRLVERFTFEGTAGGLRSNRIYAIHLDREGVVWFGTDRGVCRFDPRSPRNERVATDAESNFVRALYRTRRGELLCGTNRGLFVRDEKAAIWRPVAELARESVYAMAEDAAGRLLVGSSGGLHVDVDVQGKPQVEAELIESPLPTDETASGEALTQPEGELLEKEIGRATNKIAQGTKRKEPERAGVFSVRAIRVFQGATYLATYGRGVERLDGERRTLIWPQPGADAQLREVTTLHAEAEGRLWIGTAHAGLYVLEQGRVAAAGGAFEKLKGKAIRAIDGASARHLWFATAQGLYTFYQGGLIEVVKGVEVRAVIAEREGASGQAWCATAGGGLLRVVLDEHFGTLVSRLDAEQGLSSANAFALLRLGTSEGGAGENGNEASLLLGTNRGLVHYTPGNFAPSLVPTRILSRRLHQFDEMRAGIELPYPQDHLTLEVAALSNRTFAEQFLYAFTLTDAQGREIKRQLSHDAQLLMENLQPGRYRIEARAFTKDLVASAPLAFAFAVGRAPFPWTTTMLAVLLLLAFVALTWGAVQNRKIARTGAALREAHHELAGARLDLANEAERERRRIARDLHDQTLADLRSLLLLTDQLPAVTNSTSDNGQSRDALDPALFRAEIESVSNEIRRICEDLSPSALDNVGLAAALEWALANAVAHLPAPQKFEYEFICDEELDERVEFQTGVRMQIYRIAQEAINNVCRHAQATRVRFTVHLTAAGELILSLEDDGGGFDPHDSHTPKGRGLAGICARASLIEADVSWKRGSDGGGTVFTLRKANAARDVDLV